MTRHPGVELLIYIGIAVCVHAAIVGHPLALAGLAGVLIANRPLRGVGPSPRSQPAGASVDGATGLGRAHELYHRVKRQPREGTGE